MLYSLVLMTMLVKEPHIGVQLINTPGSIGEREGEGEGYYLKDTHTEHKV